MVYSVSGNKYFCYNPEEYDNDQTHFNRIQNIVDSFNLCDDAEDGVPDWSDYSVDHYTFYYPPTEGETGNSPFSYYLEKGTNELKYITVDSETYIIEVSYFKAREFTDADFPTGNYCSTLQSQGFRTELPNRYRQYSSYELFP